MFSSKKLFIYLSWKIIYLKVSIFSGLVDLIKYMNYNFIKVEYFFGNLKY